jgi:hypothetical protein
MLNLKNQLKITPDLRRWPQLLKLYTAATYISLQLPAYAEIMLVCSQSKELTRGPRS